MFLFVLCLLLVYQEYKRVHLDLKSVLLADLCDNVLFLVKDNSTKYFSFFKLKISQLLFSQVHLFNTLEHELEKLAGTTSAMRSGPGY